MQKMKALCILVAILPFAIAQSLNGSADKNEKNFRSIFINNQIDFGLKLLAKLEEESTGNVFFSPVGIYNALLLAFFASSRQTEASLRKFFRFPDEIDKADIHYQYNADKINRLSLSNSSTIEWSSVGKLFVSSNETVSSSMMNLLKDDIGLVDFAGNPAASVEQINDFIAAKTQQQVVDFLDIQYVSANTRLVLTSASYFKGAWKSPFPHEKTKLQIFWPTCSNPDLLLFMNQTSNFMYSKSEELDAEIIKIPYDDDRFSMVILLPPIFNTKPHISSLLGKLTLEKFKEITSPEALDLELVLLLMPKIQLELETVVTSALESLGVGDLFQPKGDLSALLVKQQEQGLDAMIHRAKIAFGEKGTVATSATAAGIHFLSLEKPKKPVRFDCRRPFVFFILDETTKAMLYAGVFKNPTVRRGIKVKNGGNKM